MSASLPDYSGRESKGTNKRHSNKIYKRTNKLLENLQIKTSRLLQAVQIAHGPFRRKLKRAPQPSQKERARLIAMICHTRIPQESDNKKCLDQTCNCNAPKTAFIQRRRTCATKKSATRATQQSSGIWFLKSFHTIAQQPEQSSIVVVSVVKICR